MVWSDVKTPIELILSPHLTQQRTCVLINLTQTLENTEGAIKHGNPEKLAT